MITIARGANDLTQAWFTALLAHHDAGPAEEVTVRPVAQGQMCDVFRARVETPQGTWALIVKLASSDPGSREVAVRLGVYETEALFYTHVAARVNVPVPRCYGAEFDPATHDFTLVLQDLSAVASPGNQAGARSIEQAVRAVRTIADLQVSTWDDNEIEHRHPQLGRTSRNTDKFARVPTLRVAFLERFGAQLEPEHVALIERVAGHAYRWATEWNGPRVLQHSDYRLDNLLFGHGPEDLPVTVIDWGGTKIGPPMVDVGYYLGGCLDPADRRDHERDILREYHGMLVAGGVSGWSLSDCERAYRRDAVYGLFLIIHAAPLVKQTVVGDIAFARATRDFADFVLELESERVLPG